MVVTLASIKSNPWFKVMYAVLQWSMISNKNGTSVHPVKSEPQQWPKPVKLWESTHGLSGVWRSNLIFRVQIYRMCRIYILFRTRQSTSLLVCLTI